MDTVIITGCNGFIGRKLTEYLLKKDIIVYGMDIIQGVVESSNFHFVKLDFNQDLSKQFEGVTIDTLYHLAWCGVSTTDKNNSEKQALNLTITRNVLGLAEALKVKKIVIPGSMSEFASCKSPVTGYEEESPSDLYARTKCMIRKVAYEFCLSKRIDLNWLLITSVYSSDRIDANLLTYCIRNLLKNEEVETTKLEQIWDYINILDLMQAMYLVGEKGKKNMIYPIGSGDIHPLSYYVEMIGDILNKRSLINVGAKPYKNQFIDNSIPNIKELKKIGFKTQVSFQDGIKEMIQKIEKEL